MINRDIRRELFLAEMEQSGSSIPKKRGEAWIENAENKVVFTSTIERTSTYTADVPSYPTENGNEVSDAVIKKPMELTVKARVKRSIDVERLTDMYVKGDVCHYHSPNYGRDDMVISRMAVREHAEVGNEWEIELTLKQIWTTAAQVVEIDETEQAGETNVQTAETAEEPSKTMDFQQFQKAIGGQTSVTQTMLAYRNLKLGTKFLTESDVGESYMDFCVRLYSGDEEASKELAKNIYDVTAGGNIVTPNVAFTVKFTELMKKVFGSFKGGRFI